MPLINLKEALKCSIDQRYAVGAFNIANHVLAEGVIQAAEIKGLPVILNIAEAHFKILDMNHFMHYLLDRVNCSSAPIVVHLDHGYTYENIIKAIHYGFSSVMFDGSNLSYQENIDKTREIVKIAHAAGISVEAELGYVAGFGEGGSEKDENIFTKPEQAEEFVQKTGIDALAVSIGTVHGIYKGKPHLNFKLLKDIRNRVSIPLVLHGGSGLRDEDFKKLILCGINKINFFTGNSAAAVNAIKKEIEKEKKFGGFPELIHIAQMKIKEVTEEKIQIFGTKPLGLKGD
ncbi:MAG: fructose-bisphosphate aldolase, class [Halanaerobiales bacterium]|nr:fructose-bisphosphate aldolase, class [Halanaerobiales bacterium]